MVISRAKGSGVRGRHYRDTYTFYPIQFYNAFYFYLFWGGYQITLFEGMVLKKELK